MTPEMKTARQELVQALSDDLAGSYAPAGEIQHLKQLLCEGFAGFNHMPIADLVQSAHDAGISRREEVARVIAILEGAPVELAGPDFTVTVEVSVTAESPAQAVQFAMDDLRDPALRWRARVKDVQASTYVDVDTATTLRLS